MMQCKTLRLLLIWSEEGEGSSIINKLSKIAENSYAIKRKVNVGKLFQSKQNKPSFYYLTHCESISIEHLLISHD